MDPIILSVPLALALRRAVIGGGALALSLAAHLIAVGDARPLPGAPLVWLAAIAAFALVGPRAGWRRRGLAATWAIAASLQLAVHAAMSAAPWAFGLAPHHAAAAPVDPRAVAPHLLAALVLALAVGVLEDLIGCVRRIVGALRGVRVGAGGPAGRPVAADPGVRPPAGSGRRPWGCRGPPPVRV